MPRRKRLSLLNDKGKQKITSNQKRTSVCNANKTKLKTSVKKNLNKNSKNLELDESNKERLNNNKSTTNSRKRKKSNIPTNEHDVSRKKISNTKKNNKKTTENEQNSVSNNVDKVTKETVNEKNVSCNKKAWKDVETISTEDVHSPKEESESENDWEEVEDLPFSEETKTQIPDKPIEIILKASDLKKHKEKKHFCWEAFFKTQFARFQKQLQINLHKVHLLCLLAHGLHLSTLCNNPDLQAQMFSLFPSDTASWSPDTFDSLKLEKLLNWFHSVISYDSSCEENNTELLENKLSSCIANQKTFVKIELVLLFIVSLRLLQFDVRLILSFQPLPFKKECKQDPGKSGVKRKAPSDKSQRKDLTNESEDSKHFCSKKRKECKIKEKTGNDDSKQDEQNNNKKILKPKNTRKRTLASKIESSESEYELEERQKINRARRNCTLNKKSLVDQGSDSNSEEDASLNRRTKLKKKKQEAQIDFQSSDSDFQPETFIPLFDLKRKTNRKTTPESEAEITVLHSTIPEKGVDHWIEIYLPSKQKWICVDCIGKRINSPVNMEKSATQPVNYVLAFDNAGCIKDVTQRYASKWLTHTQKLRIDQNWWTETLAPFKSCDEKRDLKEDEEFSAHWLTLPLPISINEYKNHPLYVLKRHLLKFEAIYPSTASVLGFVRNEPVYARDCVHTLRSRETWLKEARVVRIGEEPYKIVKARPKWNKETEKDPLLPVYGLWQTEEYIPPIAVDGKVPRNDYGNVELFKPCMLPVGTVHLPVPGLNKVARKLNIDCAPAMVGWDFYSHVPRPVMDGWIVCEEFKDVLLAAWDQDQEEIQKKEEEKREKRIYGNWKKLIRGLLIKQRLKKKYNLFSEKATEESETQADDFEKSWPRNQQSTSSTKQHHNSTPLFPCEEL